AHKYINGIYLTLGRPTRRLLMRSSIRPTVAQIGIVLRFKLCVVSFGKRQCKILMCSRSLWKLVIATFTRIVGATIFGVGGLIVAARTNSVSFGWISALNSKPSWRRGARCVR